MGKWVHSLDVHDFDQRTAYCSGCEARVEIQQTKKGWICRPGRLRAKADYRARAAARINEANRRYREAHPDRYIQSTYGLTADDRRRMLATQQGRCPICAEPRDEMFVDHDHATGAVRGLL